MMAKKPVTRAEQVEVVYEKKRWRLLKELRTQSIQTMEFLNQFHFNSIVHGSIARGDVTEKSDIDIFMPNPPSSFNIEMALESVSIPVSRRIIVQATPIHVIKAHLEINDKQCVSFPLTKLRSVEREFYKFGGEATLIMLKRDVRVPGVDKRLMLIDPTPKGHTESNVVGNEGTVARCLNISINTVLDRVRALLHRDKVGRTGVFIKKELLPNETFELALKKFADQNPAVRRRLKFFKK
ncbi:nucleotidyltransferase domain-containing protein [Candidatus Bathyarchaeota archaeon]|nr:nucleotidyltransferase domain-containing protein [Candidatus Bathyarchaeota archaeon]